MKPFYETWWFEWLFVAACWTAGWFLWHLLDHPFLDGAAASAVYMELAKSIAEGHGYTLLHTTTSVPHLAHPPVYPLLLSWVMQGLHQNDLMKLIHPFKLLNLGFYLVSIFLVYRFSCRGIRKPYPFLITGLYALAPLTVSAAGSISSEMAFLVFSMTALLVIDKFFTDKGGGITRWDWVWGGFWVVLSILTRNAGFALLAAYFLLALRHTGLKRSCVMLALVLTVLSPWYLREIFYRNFYPNQELLVQELGHETMVPHAADPFADSDHFFSRMLENAEETLIDATQHTMGALSFDRFEGGMFEKLHLDDVEVRFSEMPWVPWTLGVLVLFGVMVGMQGCSGIGSLYLGVFLAAACLIPIERQTYYLLPILPLMLFYLFMGVMRFGEWMAQVKIPVSKVAVPALVVVIGVNCLAGHLEHLRETRMIQAYYKPETSGGEMSGQQRGYLRALQWIRTNTPPRVQIVARKPSSTYVFTERKARPFPQYRQPERVLADLLRADYVLEEMGVRAVRNYLSPAIQRHPQHFRLVYNDPGSQIRIWQVQSTP